MIHMVKYRFQPAFEVRKDSPAPLMVAEKQNGESRRRRPVCHWFVGTPDQETIARQKEFVAKLVAGVRERRKQAEEKQAEERQAEEKQGEQKPAKKKPAKKKPVKKKQWKKKFY
ncbi:hypothetical protein P8452_23478 [Trifolium repens]|nr:hypothetical protein P8452_23478 [Trifolium repens]